jgi:hypothetical protein
MRDTPDRTLPRLPPLEPDPVIEAYKAGIDRTLLRESLKQTPDERIASLVALQRVAEEFRRAGERLRGKP